MVAGVGALRVLRALVFLAIAMALTTAGHVVGGGSVSGVAVLALAVVSWPVALLGSRRQRGVRHLFPALLAGQLAGHAVLAFLASAGTSAATACAASAGHHAHVVLECGDPTVAAVTAHGHASAMTGTHVAAALLLAVVMARGEALLWRVVDLVVPTLPRLRTPAVEVVPARFVVRARPRRRFLIVMPGRGPPVLA